MIADLDLPRQNGELAFAAPWESRIFGLVAAYLERTGQPWEAFRDHLITAIANAPEAATYYESFTAAFQALLVRDGVLSTEATDRLR
jgi:Nitrile hydratase beta subunit